MAEYGKICASDESIKKNWLVYSFASHLPSAL